jgi:tight adherence protein B
VSRLAWGLLALAAVVAERGVRSARRGRLLGRLRSTPPSPGPANGEARRWLVPAAVAVAGYALGGPVGVVAGIAVGLGVRRWGVRRSATAGRALRDEQIADMAGGIASAMRAGMSLAQAMGSVREEAEPPLRDDLDLLLADLEIGVELELAMDAWIARVDTDDARLLGAALRLHRRTGGDLPRVLDQVVATIRERVAIAREVRGLTAQARLSGSILGLLPVAFFAFLWVTSRADMQAALSTPAGITAVIVGVCMEAGAFLWIRHLLEVG